MTNFMYGAAGLLLCLLPAGGLALVFVIFRLRGEGWRSSIIASATCNALYVAFSTEILSVFRLITRPGLATAWVVFDAACFFYIRNLLRKKTADRSLEGESTKTSYTPTLLDVCLLAGVSLVVGLVGLTAILAPPNTWDVIAYHLPRVAMWANYKSIWNYPTFFSQQLFLSPWSEYTILHLYVLSGADYLSNLVEWFSMIGMCLSVSLIAERLGAGVRAQLFAAVACATMPGLVLEASGSMNTCVGAFWVIVCVYYFLRGNEDRSWISSAGAASAAGLAILTKGTANVFLPFLLLACCLIGDTQTRKFWLRQLPVGILIVLLLNGPMYIRNYELSGSPLGFTIPSGNDVERQYANTSHSIKTTYANVIKNAALHLGTPISSVNFKIESAARKSIAVFGIDPDDTTSTVRGGFSIPALSAHESSAGSFLQCFLIVVAMVFLFSKRYGDRKLRLIAVGICLSFILFAAMLRWSLWNARYVLPLIGIGLALASVIVERALSKTAMFLLAIVLIIVAIPFAVGNTLRPLAPWKVNSLFRRPRLEFYFAEWQQSLEPSYKFAAAQIKKSTCRDVGIDSAVDDVEYPLMVMLRQASSDIKFRFYRTKNFSTRYQRAVQPPPCAVICLRCARVPAKWFEYKDIGGKVSTFDEIAVFSSSGNTDNQSTLTIPPMFDPREMDAKLDITRDAVASSIFAPESHSGLSTALPAVTKASKDWPEKALDLQARLHAVETLSLKAWRARDSAGPVLRRGEKLDYSKADTLQMVAVSELLENWKNESPGKLREVNNLVDQLYNPWEMRLAGIPDIAADSSGECKVQIEKTATAAKSSSSAVIRQTIQLEDCSCLKSLHLGAVIASKRLGIYDSEATAVTGCNILGAQ